MNIWDNLNHFNRNEAWGEPDKMDHDFLKLLDAFREYINKKFIVLRGYGQGSVPGSIHQEGKAADGYANIEPFDLFHEALRFSAPGLNFPYFSGIGIYIAVWKKASGIPVTGIHLDIRDIWKQNHKATWGALPPPELLDPTLRAKFIKYYPDHDKFNRTSRQIYLPMDHKFWHYYYLNRNDLYGNAIKS